jgi:leucyl-tRNA synthetase
VVLPHHRLSEDIRALRYNTAVAALMEYLNTLQPRESLYDEEVSGLLMLLAPFAPHIAEELWARLGKPYSIHRQPFPAADPGLLALDLVRVAVQVNGRTRGVVELAPDADQAQAVEAARRVPAVQQHVGDRAVRRVVYVPGRVLNLVVRDTT